MSEPISPNTTIAQYTIVSKIGEGGMGEVWRARDPKLGRDVAIKVLPASLSENADRLNRFEQEAQAAGALNHPNILVIHHIGTHEGAPYIVSELLEGESLRERMAGNALPQRKAIDYALQLARGLASAHEKGIVHRDIKPDNVFITDDSRVKILDFGIAKLTGTADGQPQTEVPTRKVNTDPGTVMGTMGYMSPEQLKGLAVDHRSDIFSFGAILYEMLSGKRAFRGDSMAETMSAILREDPLDLSETNKTVSPALERVVRHCLEKNPAERFHSARDLAFAIESLSGSATGSGQTTALPVFTEGTWSKDGIIIFGADYDTALVQVSAKGGEPTPVNTAEPVRSRHPYFLPDGRHFIFPQGQRGLGAGSLDSPEIKQIVAEQRGPTVYAPPGWLIFFRNDVLMAQAFDAGKLAVSGEPTPLLTGLKNPSNARRFSVSDNGVFVSAGQWEPDYQLVWYDREGKQTGAIDAPTKVSVGQSPMLSPDGKRLVVRRILGPREGGAGGANSNIWVVDLEKGGTGLRLTDTFSQMPVWSPDGNRILHNAGNTIVVRAATGSGDAETLVPRTAFPAAWSSDGRFILYMERGVKTRMDLWALPLFGDKKEYQLLNSAFDEQNPQLSPDGHWLAYTSDETGNYEIYVKSFSADGKLGADKKIVSTAGGRLPVWRRDGSELFFIAPDGQMMTSSVKTGGTEFQFAAPKPLFKTRTLSLEGAIFANMTFRATGNGFSSVRSSATRKLRRQP